MIKNINIILLIIPILLLSFSIDYKKDSSAIYFESGYSLHQDTIYVDIKGDMTHALKYQDKFYVLFKQRVFRYGGYGKRWLCIFSNGQMEKIINCPKEMKTVYLDFYVKNDSLILKPYMDKQCYYLDLTNFQWIKIDKTDDLIFEDEEYLVYSLDFGEWGGKTWFKDKKTGQEYVLEATTPLVNKIDSIYYLTNQFGVLKITNPQLLNKCSNDVTYENIKTSGKSRSWYAEPIGFDIVYQDTTFDYFAINFVPYIVSSFVLDKELLHIYQTDTSAYIVRHKRYTIEPIQKIFDNISFYNWYYSYRCLNLWGNNELLKFQTKNEKIFGLMEMIGKEIHVTYFNNKALLEPQLVGVERATSIIVDRLNTIIPQLGNLKIDAIDIKEQTWGSFDITPNHDVSAGNNMNPNNYTIDTCRAYLVQEDSIFSNSIMYFGTKENNLVRVVTFEWEYVSSFPQSYSDEYVKKIFDSKAEFLINYISENFGQQIENDDEKRYIRRTWETSGGIRLKLHYNRQYCGMSLAIYEK